MKPRPRLTLTQLYQKYKDGLVPDVRYLGYSAALFNRLLDCFNELDIEVLDVNTLNIDDPDCVTVITFTIVNHTVLRILLEASLLQVMSADEQPSVVVVDFYGPIEIVNIFLPYDSLKGN